MAASKSDLILAITAQGATLAANIEQAAGHAGTANIITVGAQVAANIVAAIAAHQAQSAADAPPADLVTADEVHQHFTDAKTAAAVLIAEAQASLASRQPAPGQENDPGDSIADVKGTE